MSNRCLTMRHQKGSKVDIFAYITLGLLVAFVAAFLVQTNKRSQAEGTIGALLRDAEVATDSVDKALELVEDLTKQRDAAFEAHKAALEALGKTINVTEGLQSIMDERAADNAERWEEREQEFNARFTELTMKNSELELELAERRAEAERWAQVYPTLVDGMHELGRALFDAGLTPMQIAVKTMKMRDAGDRKVGVMIATSYEERYKEIRGRKMSWPKKETVEKAVRKESKDG